MKAGGNLSQPWAHKTVESLTNMHAFKSFKTSVNQPDSLMGESFMIRPFIESDWVMIRPFIESDWVLF